MNMPGRPMGRGRRILRGAAGFVMLLGTGAASGWLLGTELAPRPPEVRESGSADRPSEPPALRGGRDDPALRLPAAVVSRFPAPRP